MQAYPTLSPWIVTLALLVVGVNLLLWKIQPVTPALLLYAFQDAPLPILFSPFLIQSWHATVARMLQLGWLLKQPPSIRLSLSYIVQLYTVLLATRAGTGYIFGRSVGWQYPRLFSHTAVYEPVAGFGPLLLGALLFDEALSLEKRQLLNRIAVMFAFALLDGTPWGYMCGTAIAGIYRLLYTFLPNNTTNGLPWHTISEGGSTNHGSPSLSRRYIFFASIAALVSLGLVGSLPGMISNLLVSTPPEPHDVHIVMLTIPRLRDLTSDVMIESIQSYVAPWHANANSTLTVFAHLGLDGKHIAFDRAKAWFHTSADAHTRPLPIDFHVEQPQQPPVMGHHAHLADAVRYASSVGHEWTMFVEDDFVLCGQWGWENFMRVMARLNNESAGKRPNGAFIGTGGSGLVFHRSLLPTLEHLLSVIASMDAGKLGHSPMPADVLLQQCLSGELHFCPADGYVISSRMLMGHRGGQLSTGNRLYEDGKWECGWRHPQHGNKGVEVVVV